MPLTDWPVLAGSLLLVLLTAAMGVAVTWLGVQQWCGPYGGCTPMAYRSLLAAIAGTALASQVLVAGLVTALARGGRDV